MSEIDNKARFPFDVKQERSDYCMPANIRAVSMHLKPGFSMTQSEIMIRYYANGGPIQPSFGAMREHLLRVDPDFTSWADSEEISGLPNVETFIQRLRATLETRVPQIISVPVLLPGGGGISGHHMLTVIKCDETNLEVYDPFDYPRVLRVPTPREISIDKLKQYLSLANSGVPDSLVLRLKV